MRLPEKLKGWYGGVWGRDQASGGSYGLCSAWFAREESSFGVLLMGRIGSAAEYGALTEAPVCLGSSQMRESSHLTGSMNWK